MKKVLLVLVTLLWVTMGFTQTGKIITVDNDTILTYGYTSKGFKVTTFKDSLGTDQKINNDEVKSFTSLKIKEVKSKDKIDKHSAGYHVSKAGMCYNKSVVLTGIGVALGTGGFLLDEDLTMIIGGGASVACVVTAIVFGVIGNYHLKKAGKLMLK